MTNFTFIATETDSENESGVTVNFKSETWIDAFPQFLNLMKASGFFISNDTMLYVPNVSKDVFADRDFLLFDTDLVESTQQKCKCKCATPKENDDKCSW